MNICVFCASSSSVKEPYISAARELGEQIGKRGHNLVFGGYDSGLMGVVSHAVHDAGGKVIGVVPDDVSKFKTRKIFPCDELHEVENISRRKDLMSSNADAFVAAPGGFGTLDELYEVLVEQKLSSGAKKPIAIYNFDGYYDTLEQMTHQMVEKGFVPAEDLNLFFVTSDPEQIVKGLEERLA
ncbi:MAG: TIGR00730 family Rossman fold protein [Coriobacteriales bacterium]|jgi:uncharacterized protein (TIGR00730 family)